MMNIKTILNQLETSKNGFPRRALEAAIAQREAITPELLKILEYAGQNIDEVYERPNYMAHIYALFLLAQFREARAYPLIVKFFSIPGDDVMDVTGDVVTEDLGSILASVSHGDPGLIKELVENKDANEYVRSAALRGLITLVACGQLSRDEVLTYFKSLLQGKLERDNPFVWGSLVYNCGELYPDTVYDEIKQAFADDLVEESYIKFDWVDEKMATGKDQVLKELNADWKRNVLIDDAIQELEGWACFQPEKPKPLPVKPWQALVKPKKIGRNEPCPCGSGRKYKHCCGKRT